MATVVKTWVWLSNADGWSLSSGSLDALAWTGSYGTPVGCLHGYETGNGATGSGTASLTGITWEDLGVPAGATVTAVRVYNAATYGVATKAGTNYWGARADHVDVTIAATMGSSYTLYQRLNVTSSDASWVTASGSEVTVPAGSQPSNSSIGLTITLECQTTVGNGSQASVGIDQLSLTITYTESSLTAVTQTLTPTYGVLNKVTQTLSPTYDVQTSLTAVSQTLTPTYAVLNKVPQTLAPTYGVLSLVSQTLTPTYSMREVVLQTLAPEYYILTTADPSDITVVGYETRTWDNIQSGVIVLPTGWQAGDICLAIFYSRDESKVFSKTNTTSQWYVVSNTAATGYGRQYAVIGKLADSNELGFTANSLTDQSSGAIYIVLRGAELETSGWGQTTKSDTGEYPSAPDLGSVLENEMCIGFVGQRGANSNYAACDGPYTMIGYAGHDSTYDIIIMAARYAPTSDQSSVTGAGFDSGATGNYRGLSVPVATLYKAGTTLTPTYNIEQSVTAVSQTLTPTYGILNKVSQTLAPSFTIRELVGQSLTPSYSMRQVVAQTLAPTYGVLNAVAQTLTPTYGVLNKVAQTLTPTYAVLNKVAQTLSPTYHIVAERVTQTLTPTYNVIQHVGQTLAPTYAVLNRVTQTLAPTYNIATTVAQTLTPTYSMREVASQTLSPVYDLESTLTSVLQTLSPSYDVIQHIGQTIAPTYDIVNYVSQTLTPTYIIRANIVTAGLRGYFSAARADGSNPGSNSPATTKWENLADSSDADDGTLSGFAYTEASGWAGSGTESDPYRLVYEGTGSADGCALQNFGVVSDKVFTFEAWVMGDAITPVTYHSIMAETGLGHDGSYESIGLVATYFAGSVGYAMLYYRVWDASSGVYRTNHATGPALSIMDGQLHHVVATSDGTYHRVYVDGVGGVVKTNPVGTAASERPTRIGGLTTVDYAWDGGIVDARVYDVALTEAEVEQNYLAGIAAPLRLATQTLEAEYSVLNKVGQTLTPTYDVRQSVQQTLAPTYDVIQHVGTTLEPTYEVCNRVAQTVVPTYVIRNLAAQTLSPTFSIRNLATKELAPEYDVFQLATKTLEPTYDILVFSTAFLGDPVQAQPQKYGIMMDDRPTARSTKYGGMQDTASRMHRTG